jgi:hypothetical protein
VGYHPTATLETQDLIPAIGSYIRAGRCVLFVGAGLSKAVGYPDWKELLGKLIREVSSGRNSVTGQQELEALLKAGKYADVADQCREQIMEALGRGTRATVSALTAHGVDHRRHAAEDGRIRWETHAAA